MGRRRSCETTRLIRLGPDLSSRSRRDSPGRLADRSSTALRGGSGGGPSALGVLDVFCGSPGSELFCKWSVSTAITSSRYSASKTVMSPVFASAQPTAVPSGRLAYRRSCPYRFQRVTFSSTNPPSSALGSKRRSRQGTKRERPRTSCPRPQWSAACLTRTREAVPQSAGWRRPAVRQGTSRSGSAGPRCCCRRARPPRWGRRQR